MKRFNHRTVFGTLGLLVATLLVASNASSQTLRQCSVGQIITLGSDAYNIRSEGIFQAGDRVAYLGKERTGYVYLAPLAINNQGVERVNLEEKVMVFADGLRFLQCRP